MTTLTLEAYERAERELKMHEARAGMVWHAVATVLVWAVVIPINIFLATGFPWSLFVVGGMGIGLFFHWVGYRRTEQDIATQQAAAEARARTGT
jgi:hypothetical protein